MNQYYDKAALKVKNVSPRQWQRLTDFIPQLEKGNYGDSSRIEQQKNSGNVMPYVKYSNVVLKFIEQCYEAEIVISFNWNGWLQEEKIFENQKSFIQQADLAQCAMLLTAHIHREHSCDGHLFNALEDGSILHILKRIEALLN